MSKDNKRLRTFVKHTVNPVLRNFAHSSRGPFALLRHVGRSSGKKYEIPIMVWRLEDGFMIVLTYGRNVDWLRNLQVAGQGSLLWHKKEYTLRQPEFIDEKKALPALPPFIKRVLALRGAHEFVKFSSQSVS
jgi:deazaflavin-dependent oxidoreductase (nitroreductase family)